MSRANPIFRQVSSLTLRFKGMRVPHTGQVSSALSVVRPQEGHCRTLLRLPDRRFGAAGRCCVHAVRPAPPGGCPAAPPALRPRRAPPGVNVPSPRLSTPSPARVAPSRSAKTRFDDPFGATPSTARGIPAGSVSARSWCGRAAARGPRASGRRCRRSDRPAEPSWSRLRRTRWRPPSSLRASRTAPSVIRRPRRPALVPLASRRTNCRAETVCGEPGSPDRTEYQSSAVPRPSTMATTTASRSCSGAAAGCPARAARAG